MKLLITCVFIVGLSLSCGTEYVPRTAAYGYLATHSHCQECIERLGRSVTLRRFVEESK